MKSNDYWSLPTGNDREWPNVDGFSRSQIILPSKQPEFCTKDTRAYLIKESGSLNWFELCCLASQLSRAAKQGNQVQIHVEEEEIFSWNTRTLLLTKKFIVSMYFLKINPFLFCQVNDYILKSGQEMRIFYPFFLQFCFCVHCKVSSINNLIFGR